MHIIMNDANNIQGMPRNGTSSFDDGSVRTIIVKEKVNWTLIILVIVIVAFGAYILFMSKVDDKKVDDTEKKENIAETVPGENANDSNNNTEINSNDTDEHADPAYDPANNAGEQEFVDDEPNAATAIPDNWKPVVNKSQGYTAHRPNNYFYRIFSGSVLGIDPNAIPENSEYVGVISIFTSTDSFDNEVIRAKGIIDNETVKKVTYSNGVWTVITGSVPADEMFPERLAYYAIIEIKGKTHVITMMAEGESEYNTYIDNAKKFTEYIVWEVIED